MSGSDGYSMAVNVVVSGPNGTMFNMNMEWVNMSYSQLVDLEEVVGHGLIAGPVSLGRAVSGGGPAPAPASRK